MELKAYKDDIKEYMYYMKDGRVVCHGFSKGLYSNGQLEYEENYKDGKLHGLCRAWYRNGQIRDERNYFNGVEEEEYFMSKDW